VNYFILVCFFVFSLNSTACDGGMPLGEKVTIRENSIFANDMKEQQFKSILKEFEKFFLPMVESDNGRELIVIGSWASNTVNAFAEKIDDKVYITIYGGLARHQAITEDGLVATLCHELGHHYGGYPKKSTNRWSSAEGQADYYATMKCLRRYWASADNKKALEGKVIPETLKLKCEQSFKNEDQQMLCQRMGLAGRSVSLMIQALDHDSIEPKFDTPDTLRVRAMNYMHPYAQCRLDTYFNGALCPVSEMIEFDDDEETTGACHQKNGDFVGLRPQCWFFTRL
jgi:hypothetical protein